MHHAVELALCKAGLEAAERLPVQHSALLDLRRRASIPALAIQGAIVKNGSALDLWDPVHGIQVVLGAFARRRHALEL